MSRQDYLDLLSQAGSTFYQFPRESAQTIAFAALGAALPKRLANLLEGEHESRIQKYKNWMRGFKRDRSNTSSTIFSDLPTTNLDRAFKSTMENNMQVSLTNRTKVSSRPFFKRSPWMKPVPYLPRTQVEKSLQPLIKWKTFSKGGTMSVTNGKQLVQDMTYLIASKSYIKDVYNKLFTDIISTNFNNIVYRSIDSGTAQDAPYNGTLLNDMPPLLCHKWQRYYHFMNTGLNDVYIELWELMVRTEGLTHSTYPYTNWVNDLADGYNTGLRLVKNNTVAPTMDKDYPDTPNDPNARPGPKCITFWQDYKCTGKHKIKLPAGKHVTLNVGIPGFAISQKKLFQTDVAGTPAWKLGEVTHIHMVMVNTPMAYDNASDNQPIGRADGFISFRWEDYMEFSMPIKSRTHFEWTTNVGNEDPTTYGEQYPDLGTPAMVFSGFNKPEQVIGGNMETDAV